MIIETCPACGADLEHTVLTSDPPIRKVKCSRCGWSHEETEEVVRVPYVTGYMETPTPCRSCPNNSLNGGSGICHCILGTPITM